MDDYTAIFKIVKFRSFCRASPTLEIAQQFGAIHRVQKKGPLSCSSGLSYIVPCLGAAEANHEDAAGWMGDVAAGTASIARRVIP